VSRMAMLDYAPVRATFARVRDDVKAGVGESESLAFHRRRPWHLQ
jgi:hypothetical protein